MLRQLGGGLGGGHDVDLVGVGDLHADRQVGVEVGVGRALLGVVLEEAPEDDFDLLADCDWIIEVVLERLDIKQGLYRKIAAIRRADTIVSSSSSESR